MRLNRFLARCGLGSRRKCESLITAGRIAIDGNIVTTLSTSVDEQQQVVTVDGKRVTPAARLIYILLNKPRGYVTTTKDELGRKTVLDLLPDRVRVFPVGRLDKNTEGALILTNDGALAFRLMHPRFVIDKVYQVWLDKAIINPHIKKLQTGIMLPEGKTSPGRVEIINGDRKKLELTIHEGRKRQVRRMFESLGYRVVKLVRTRIATITIDNLKPSKWRYLTDQEIAELMTIVAEENE